MPKCVHCGKERSETDKDYNPLDVLFNNTLGWYSGDDGELCGDCMTDLIRNQ